MEARAIRDEDRARVGTVLHDKWTLERLIGVGGMGAVYAARHRNGARAAVKVFAPRNETEQLRERFLREGYAANKVDHPGAVKVLDDDVIDKGPDTGTAYLVMELLEGESLQERLQKQPPLGERDLLEIADGVLAVLEAAHANGVVHRDLKPDNLFLVGSQIKVLDFGLARLLETQEKSWNGLAFGTPTYMSPEQAAGKIDEIDGRTDIYALGSILFQLASNKRIHDAAHTLGLVVRMATTPAPKLRSVAPDVSEPYATIVDRALQFDRDARYPSAAEMRADVRAALTVATGEPAVVTIVPESIHEVPTREVALVPPKRARLFSPTVVVFVLAAVVGFVGFEYVKRSSTPVQVAPAPDVDAEAPVEELDGPGDDAGDDAGDDEEEDDDEEDAEAPLRDASPLIHRSYRPAAKRRPVHRPTTPRRPKKKRWHW